VLRDELERLLEDLSLLTIAFAIALGWSLFQLAHGVANFVDGLTTHLSSNDGGGFTAYEAGGGLTWEVGHHIVTLDGVLFGLLELAFVLAIAAFVRSKLRD
jgi:hypothetical protein